MNADNYCTVLEVERVISNEIFGFTCWVSFVKLIDVHTEQLEGIVYFTNKNDALNLDVGDKIPNHAICYAIPNPGNNRDTSFNG